MKKMSIKTVVAVGIGAALFFVLARFVSIPSGMPEHQHLPAVRCSGPVRHPCTDPLPAA